MAKLADRVAVVTGAQQGIGRAIALAMAAEGAHIVINWLDDPEAAADIAKKAWDLGVKAEAVQGDVSSPADVETIMAAADRLVMYADKGVHWSKAWQCGKLAMCVCKGQQIGKKTGCEEVRVRMAGVGEERARARCTKDPWR